MCSVIINNHPTQERVCATCRRDRVISAAVSFHLTQFYEGCDHREKKCLQALQSVSNGSNQLFGTDHVRTTFLRCA